MSVEPEIPTLDEFLSAPRELVAGVAPATAIYAVGGTRRSAALAGISTQSDAYMRFSCARMVACFEHFFRLGVRHLFTNMLRPSQLEEVGAYSERLLGWLSQGLAGPEALADYRRLGWRARLVGGEQHPALAETATHLAAATPDGAGPTLWFYVAPTRGALWEQMLRAAHAAKAQTQGALIQALYGEEIPPAGVYIGFGKPLITNDLVSPVLFGETQCYWTQRAGYELDEDLLRRIFYDYAYLRRTWIRDKSARYTRAREQRHLWESRTILGFGTRIDGFWYPDPRKEQES